MRNQTQEDLFENPAGVENLRYGPPQIPARPAARNSNDVIWKLHWIQKGRCKDVVKIDEPVEILP
jgi:hypothetical protein